MTRRWGHDPFRTGLVQALEGAARQATTTSTAPGLAVALVHHAQLVWAAGYGSPWTSRSLATGDAGVSHRRRSMPMASLSVGCSATPPVCRCMAMSARPPSGRCHRSRPRRRGRRATASRWSCWRRRDGAGCTRWRLQPAAAAGRGGQRPAVRRLRAGRGAGAAGHDRQQLPVVEDRGHRLPTRRRRPSDRRLRLRRTGRHRPGHLRAGSGSLPRGRAGRPARRAAGTRGAEPGRGAACAHRRPGDRWPLGAWLRPRADPSGDLLACHEGANRGWRAGLALLPDRRAGTAALANGDDGSAPIDAVVQTWIALTTQTRSTGGFAPRCSASWPSRLSPRSGWPPGTLTRT